MSDSTNIFDLPTDPIGVNTNNITIAASENIPEAPNNLDQGTISEIINGIQRASLSGSTQLSSRDIPMTTSSHSIDPHIQPNYVPPTENTDYIKNYEETNNIINQYNKNYSKNNSLDEMYNEIQTPLLLSVLYFLFQLPFFKKLLFQYLPILFSNDGNLNINGFLFMSILFGMIFYLLNKFSSYFGTF